MDRIPQAGALYIGGLRAIDKPDSLTEAGITHILSILEYDHCDYPEYAHFQRLWIRAADSPSDDLLQHFAMTTCFIGNVLADGGTILVHCYMGVSRSAATVCAFLMQKCGVGPQKALEMVREGRAMCGPSDEFMEQREIWGRMLKVEGREREGVYQKWLEGWDHERGEKF